MLGMYRSRHSVHARSGAGGGVRFTGGTGGVGGIPPTSGALWSISATGIIQAMPEPEPAPSIAEDGTISGV